MDSPQSIEYVGLKVSISRLTADQRRKVSPWSQVACSLQSQQHSPTACRDNLAFFLQQKKEEKKSSFATNSETGQVFKFQQKCLFVTFRRKLHTNAWGVEDNDISNEYSVWMSEMCVCVLHARKTPRRTQNLQWCGAQEREGGKVTKLVFVALVEATPGVSTLP